MFSPHVLIVRIAGVVVLGMSLAGSAQTISPSPSVQQVLAGVRSNVDAMIATLPNISCSEHVHSAYLHKGKVKYAVTLESVLQATRMNAKNGDFTEERTSIHPISTIGKPPGHPKKYTLPFSLTNGFGITYKTFLSSEFEANNTYKITTEAGTSWLGLVVTRKGYPTVATFWLDPNSYQIRRFDIVMPDSKASAGNKHFLIYEVGTTDYGLVQLGQKPYLIPEKVHDQAWMKHEGSPDQLTYDATYSNCHIFISSSRIITDPTAVVP